jgi:NADPH:quinone reductase-like Zn-dependent oxidoreductase
VSGEAAGRLFDCVAERGELVCYGLLAGDQVIIPSAQLIFRDVNVRGYSRLRSLRALSPAESELLYADLFEGVASGLFHTPVLKTFTFEEIHDAVELAERSGGEGKVILIPPSA